MEKAISKLLAMMCIISIVLACAGISRATLYVYTNEAEFLAKASESSTFNESFEGDVWATTRESLEGLTTISNLGLTWTSSSTIRASSTYKHDGEWGIYDYAWSIGDTIHDDSICSLPSAQTLYGIGGWFKSWKATDINISLDGVFSASTSLAPEFGPFSFLGVIETHGDGFNNVHLYSTTGDWGCDDFTFVDSPIPNPEPATVLLLLIGLVGIIGIKKRFS